MYSKQSGGFTLIEILIAIALVAIIAGILITNYTGMLSSGSEEVARIWVKQIDLPLIKYRIDTGNYPTTEEGLAALLVMPQGKSKGWHGPYIKEIPNDPWRRPYQYRFPGQHNPAGYDVWSWGPAGEGSGNEIGNWKTE